MKIKTTFKSHSPMRPCMYPGFVWLYAEKGGGPVLKGEASWGKISGFLFHNKQGHYTVSFRRHWS